MARNMPPRRMLPLFAMLPPYVSSALLRTAENKGQKISALIFRNDSLGFEAPVFVKDFKDGHAVQKAFPADQGRLRNNFDNAFHAQGFQRPRDIALNGSDAIHVVVPYGYFYAHRLILGKVQ